MKKKRGVVSGESKAAENKGNLGTTLRTKNPLNKEETWLACPASKLAAPRFLPNEG